MHNTSHIAQRLLTTYDDMPRGERKLADLLLEDVGVVGQFTAADLAEQAGVSKATAARLFRRLGYGGYRDAQREIREARSAELAAPQVPALSGGTLSPGEYLDAEVKHLVRSFEALPADQVTEAVQMLCAAAKLWVVGFGEDYPLALFARAMLIKVFPDIRMIPLSGFPVPEEFASIKPADTVLAFGVGRRNPELRNIIGSSRRAGAKIILVTNTLAPGDKRGADVILRGRSDGPTLFGSMTAPVSLITYLCARVASRTGDSAVQRLQHIESIHSQWAEESSSNE
ncbi:MurR/RpiR family transcriptional regulator [Marinibacterium profundimaris]|uniref:Sugar isomerase n=1 Tax=Marinibacterium profundimaris TaxID=1679460 RepID=A0A225NMX9_9RHOB|nr:MurR/RpiR family transcriptional regulator [Marinibacterium profundimaris]OWU74934.1 sugar isomerase [Marinibacterium profundimaris]